MIRLIKTTNLFSSYCVYVYVCVCVCVCCMAAGDMRHRYSQCACGVRSVQGHNPEAEPSGVGIHGVISRKEKEGEEIEGMIVI